MTLRVVSNASAPLSKDDLQLRGNDLFGEALLIAVAAMRASVDQDFLFKKKTFRDNDVRRIRDKARAAAQEWAKLDAVLSEIVNEVMKIKVTSRSRPTS